MQIIFKELSEGQFKENSCPILFGGGKDDRSFGIILAGSSCLYKLSWQSDLLKPIFYPLNNRLFCAGVDMDFSIANLKGNIYLKLKLDYFFYQAKIFDGYVFVITELDITMVSIKQYEVIKKYYLPDFFEQLNIDIDGKIEVECANGSILKIPHLV